jgi:predicted aminopeptidase
VAAYSTLGWFDDPVLNTMLRWPEDVLAGSVMHELAHQQLFVKGDTAFNESFATFVEQQGLAQYLAGQPQLREQAARHGQQEAQFLELMLAARGRLAAVYAGAAPDGDKRRAKQAELARLRRDYETLKAGWGGDAAYDAWLAGDLNNARLLPFGLYHEWVPAFAALFREAGGEWATFYREAERLADLDPEPRREQLRRLRGS